MVGCCGFLSFSSVFCKFGGRFEASLYIHFTRRWVKSRRRSSALRRKKREGRGGKERRSSQLDFAGSVCRQGGLGLPTPPCLGRHPLAEGVCGGSPRLCARSLSRPPLRLAYAGREAEQADVLCLHRCAATASISPSMKGVGPAVAGLYR